jgi:hypothetical protein
MTKGIALILSLFAFAAVGGCGKGGGDSAPATDVNMIAVPVENTANTATPEQHPALGEVIAHVTRLYGTNAFVGSVNATEGMAIRLNEHFYTRAGTKMEVSLDKDKSIILLDENTDPDFFTTAECFWIRLTSGRMAVTNKNPLCAKAGKTKSSQHSFVIYQATGATTTIAVFEGQVTTIEPPDFTVNAGQMLTVQNGETSGPQTMSQDTINQLQAWIPRVIL